MALEKRETSLEWAERDPDFDSLRGDPRFAALIEETKPHRIDRRIDTIAGGVEDLFPIELSLRALLVITSESADPS